MTHPRELIRRTFGNPDEGTAGRKARLAGLIGVPVAGAFLIGVILGVIGQSLSAGATFILLAIPVAIGGGILTGRAVLGERCSCAATRRPAGSPRNWNR